jgi:hypothetical protein
VYSRRSLHRRLDVDAAMADSALERNKQNVMAFYDLMFNDCRPAEAVDRVIQEESANGNGMF